MWQIPPSKQFGIRDNWLAYDFNQAIAWFGNYVESKLAEKTKKGKPKYTLKGILNGEAEPQSALMMMMAKGMIGQA